MRVATLFAGGLCAPTHTCSGVPGAAPEVVSGRFSARSLPLLHRDKLLRETASQILQMAVN